MTHRAAVLNEDGDVVNVILVGDNGFDPGEGLTLEILDEENQKERMVAPGWRRAADGKWTKPGPPLPPPPTAEERLDALLDRLSEVQTLDDLRAAVEEVRITPNDEETN